MYVCCLCNRNNDATVQLTWHADNFTLDVSPSEIPPGWHCFNVKKTCQLYQLRVRAMVRRMVEDREHFLHLSSRSAVGKGKEGKFI